MMRYKIKDVFIVVVFFGFIFAFAILSLLGADNVSSQLESRKLAEKPVADPELILSGEYFKNYEKYFSDQFPLRNNWIEANALLDRKLLKKDYIRDIYIADDGYMITPVNPANKGNSIPGIQKKIDTFASELKEQNVKTYFALVPNKSTVMEDKLPDYIESHANDYSDKLLKGFSSDVGAIDFRDEILSQMEKEENLYFYSDHHWKPKAALIAYQKIINEMSEAFPEVGKPLEADDFVWKEHPSKFFGSEARKITKVNVPKPDTVTIVEAKDKQKPLTVCYSGDCNKSLYNLNVLENEETYTNRYTTYMSGDVKEGIIKNPNVKNGFNVLILKDSYANPLIQFMAMNFEETRLLDLRKHKNLDVKEYALKHNIDAVLFVHNINSIVITPAFINLGGSN